MTAGKAVTTLFTLAMTAVPAFTALSTAVSKAKSIVTLFGIETGLAMWQVTLIVGAIAAAIALAVHLYNIFKKNTLEAQLKTAKEEAANMQTALQDAKDAAEEVKNQFE